MGFYVITLISASLLLYRFIVTMYGPRMDPSLIRNRAILITGATSGIGLLLARKFHSLGFTIIAAYYDKCEAGYAELMQLDEQTMEKESQQNQADESVNTDDTLVKDQDYEALSSTLAVSRIRLVPMDVTSTQSIDRAAVKIFEWLDGHNLELYAVINNAGLGLGCAFEWQGVESIRSMTETNLIGPMLVTRKFIKRIIQAKGRIVNVSSGLYIYPVETSSVYCATKMGLASFTAALNADIKRYGASATCVMPGNFIYSQSSNILFARIREFQRTIKAMSGDERALYAGCIEDMRGVLRNMIQQRLENEHSSRNEDGRNLRMRVENRYDINLAQLDNKKKSLGKYNVASIVSKLIAKIVRIIDGSFDRIEQQNSGLLSGFERAVMLRKPPTFIFAGHFLYNHVFGPITDLCYPLALSRVIAQLWSWSHKQP